jgi:hypothetical protein
MRQVRQFVKNTRKGPSGLCDDALPFSKRHERSRRMIYLTQLIYVHEGHEHDFQRFEDIVLPRLIQYAGELVLRLRPDRASMIAGSSELPYEVHVLRFETEEGLDGYSLDEERRRWLHLKDQSVHRAILIKGVLA